MTIQELLVAGNIADIQKELKKRPEFAISQEDAAKQYNVKDHKVFDTSARPDKIVKRPTGVLDSEGNEKMEDSLEYVTRVGLSYQNLIVDRSVGFMLGNPVELKKKTYSDSDQSDKLYAMVEKCWNDNKMDMVLPEVAERFFSEMEVALIFYFVEEENYWGEFSKSKFKLKVRICAKELGDTLYPHFDLSGDMDALSREYTTTLGDVKVQHFDIYTNEGVFKWEKGEGDWLLVKPEGAGASVKSPGKIMAVYINRKQPDWANVQTLIERLETSQSNHGDTNDYNGAPILFLKGNLKGAPAKGSRGKVLAGSDSDADAKYLSWDNAPESIKLELENLKDSIFELTQTPDISFKALQSGLSNTSGVAMKLLFTDAHMKARKNWRSFGMSVQRIVNVMKSAIARVVEVSLEKEESNLQITPICIPYLPQNELELSTMCDNSVAAGSISKRTAYENHPLVSDPDLEEERVKAEETIQMEGAVD